MTAELRHLQQFIVEQYNLQQLRALCFDLHVWYEDLPDESMFDKVWSLLLLLGKRRQLERLLQRLAETRPQSFDEAGFGTEMMYVDQLYTQLPEQSPEPGYDTVALRKLLNESFNDEEFTSFTFDYFREAQQDFGASMRKGQKIQLLLEYCSSRGRFPDLIEALKLVRPVRYRNQFGEIDTAEAPAVLEVRQYVQTPHQVFISHGHQDSGFAHRLASDLVAEGWDIWIAPESIKAGETWVQAINRGLAESSFFVLILTPSAVDSFWVRRETNAAISLEGRGKLRFIPLGVEPAEAPPLWEGYQRIPFQDEYRIGLAILLDALEGKEPEPKPQPIETLPTYEPPPDWQDGTVRSPASPERVFLGAREWLRIHLDATVVDLHAHADSKTLLFHQALTRPLWQPLGLGGEMNPLSLPTSFFNLEQGGVDVLIAAASAPERFLWQQNTSFWLALKLAKWLPASRARSIWREFVEPDYFNVALEMVDGMEQRVEYYDEQILGMERQIKVVRSAQELSKALQEGTIAIVHSVEGAHCLEGNICRQHEHIEWDDLHPEDQRRIRVEVLENLDTLQEKGVAYLTLAHYFPNKIAAPTMPYTEHYALTRIPREELEYMWRVTSAKGLTSLGAEVVRRMIDLGMLIDVSHATLLARQQIYALIEESGKGSPTIIASHVGAHAVNPDPYNLRDWEIRWIAEHGGVIGVPFTNHWLIPHESRLGLNFLIRHLEHIIEKGGDTVVGIGTDFGGDDPSDDLENASQLPKVTQRMVAEQFSGETIDNILGGNALRVLLEGWGERY